jgi:parvulin-like peptidyl-prolyl isomerase
VNTCSDRSGDRSNAEIAPGPARREGGFVVINRQSRNCERRRSIYFLSAALASFAFALAARAQTAPPGATSSVVARVGGLPIGADELDGAVTQYKQAQEQASGQKLAPEQMADFQRTVLEQLVRQRLLRLEAQRQHIPVSDSEAIGFLQSQPMFRPNGKYDPSRWAAFASDPGRVAAATADVKELLAAEKLFRRLEKQLTPTPAQVDAKLGAMTDRVGVRILAPRSDWFDSGYPLDADSIRARYRAMTAAMPATPRVGLSLALVPFPVSINGPDTSPKADQATRSRADSLLKAIRGGTASFDTVAAALGGIRDSGTWSHGQEAGVFYEDRSLGEEALSTRAGQVLSRPVKLPGGYGLVRVDASDIARGPSLVQLADSVARSQARADAAARARRQFLATKSQHPEAFRSLCVTWKGAVVDTSKLPEPKLSDAEMRDYYDTHKSEFARLDPNGKGLAYASFDEVKDVVRRRAEAEKRGRTGAEIATRIATAWEAGKRDEQAEKSAKVWEVTSEPGDPPPPGASQNVVNAMFEAPIGKAQGYRDATGAYGYVVSKRDSACEASKAEIDRLALASAADSDRAALENEAHALFAKNPKRYQQGKTYYVSYLVIDPKSWSISEIPEDRMKRYYREHPEEFGQVAGVHARHILFAVTPRTDSLTQLKRAQSVLALAKAGAPFDSLAKIYSDDPATKNQGGDTGWFQRGQTSPEFEDLAFSLDPGQVGGPVRTRFGYHLLQCVEKREQRLNAYEMVAGDVGKAVAKQIADSLAYRYADSLAHQFRTRAELTRIANSRSYPLRQEYWSVGAGTMGEVSRDPATRDALAKMTGSGPVRMVVPLAATAAVAWVDSIGKPRPATWEMAHDQAMEDAMAARRARGRQAAIDQAGRELTAGASWDSVIAPWGGSLDLAHRPGEALPGIGSSRAVDSLIFGAGANKLATGKTAVVKGVDGPVLVYLAGRESTRNPSAADRDALTDMMRERAGYEYFEKLKARYPVRILRADLRRPVQPPVAP